MGNLAKVMKLAGNDDSITLKAEEDAGKLVVMFDNSSKMLSDLGRAGEKDHLRHEPADS